MSIIKQKNWFISLIFMITVPYLYILLLAYMLDLYDENAWYSKWQYWALGSICLIFPALIMFVIFELQMLVKIAHKLSVPGDEIYNTPYSWIICLIVPVIGWILLSVMIIYLCIWIAIMIKEGKSEKYAK